MIIRTIDPIDELQKELNHWLIGQARIDWLLKDKNMIIVTAMRSKVIISKQLIEGRSELQIFCAGFLVSELKNISRKYWSELITTTF